MCSASGLSKPNRASGNCSIRFSISSVAMPSPLGGSSYTFQPRYSVEIGTGHRAAQPIRSPQNRFGNGTAIECLGASLGNQLQRSRQLRISKNSAGLGRRALRKENALAVLIHLNRVAESAPAIGDQLGYRKSVGRVIN